jgi:hypothetical protein
MLILESEVDQLWCPLSRTVPAEGGTITEATRNRTFGAGETFVLTGGTACVGSACALWIPVGGRHRYGYCGAGRRPIGALIRFWARRIAGRASCRRHP